MDAPDDLVDAVEALALMIAVAASPHPASEALNVPGEPRIVDGMILNCIRFLGDDPDAVASLDEAVVPSDDVLADDSIEVEPECHFVNIHDAAGGWRVDFSFHFLNADSGDTMVPVGVAGVMVMDTTRYPNLDATVQRIDKLITLLQQASEIHDDRWDHSPSLYLH